MPWGLGLSGCGSAASGLLKVLTFVPQLPDLSRSAGRSMLGRAAAGPAAGHLVGLVLGLACLLSLHVANCQDKGASISLRAAWKASPYMSEAAELAVRVWLHI